MSNKWNRTWLSFLTLLLARGPGFSQGTPGFQGFPFAAHFVSWSMETFQPSFPLLTLFGFAAEVSSPSYKSLSSFSCFTQSITFRVSVGISKWFVPYNLGPLFCWWCFPILPFTTGRGNFFQLQQTSLAIQYLIQSKAIKFNNSLIINDSPENGELHRQRKLVIQQFSW